MAKNAADASENDVSCLSSETFNTFTVITTAFVCVLTLFGNSLIFLSIYKYRRHFRGSLYQYIGNLAAADWLLGLVLILPVAGAIFPELRENWYFCVAKSFGLLTSFSVSTLTLLFMSFDRYMAIAFPLKHLVNTKKRKFFLTVITLIWVVCLFGLCLPYLPITKPKDSFICETPFVMSQSVDLTASISLVVVLILNTFLYYLTIRKMKKRLPSATSENKFGTKTTVMALVFSLFVLCWLPFVVCTFIIKADALHVHNIICVREYLLHLGLLNSAMNWIVYGLANQKFRTAFKTLLWCRCCKFIEKPNLSFKLSEKKDPATVTNNVTGIRAEENLILTDKRKVRHSTENDADKFAEFCVQQTTTVNKDTQETITDSETHSIGDNGKTEEKINGIDTSAARKSNTIDFLKVFNGQCGLYNSDDGEADDPKVNTRNSLFDEFTQEPFI